MKTKAKSGEPAPEKGQTVSVRCGRLVRRPFTCDCGQTVSPRSKYYDDGFCFRCARWDSRGGAYRVRFNYRVKGILPSLTKEGGTP